MVNSGMLQWGRICWAGYSWLSILTPEEEVRLISARRATSKERRVYEEKG